MAEPGPDCSSLLDEDLSSFVFSYLADSQVGSAGRGGLCCAVPGALHRRGERTDPPAACRGTPGRRRAGAAGAGCGARLLRRVPVGVRRSRSLRGCGTGRPRGCARPSRGSRAAAAPQPRRRFQHHSHVDSRAPRSPIGRQFGGDRGQVDGAMVAVQKQPPPRLLGLPRRWGGGGAVVGGAPQGAARWGLIEPGCGMSHAERQFHAYGLGSWGMEVWGGGVRQRQGSRCCESPAPKCGWAVFWTEPGIKIRLRLLGSSGGITRASRAGYRARMLFHFGGCKRGAIQ